MLHPDTLEAPPVKLTNVPHDRDAAGGWRYHLGRIVYAPRSAWMARAFRADLALIDSEPHIFRTRSLSPGGRADRRQHAQRSLAARL